MLSRRFLTSGRQIYQVNRCFSVSSNLSAKNVAMILSGCGVFDGSEIAETTSAIIHLSRQGANVTFYAPNTEQLHVVNHYNGDIQPESRNILVESARITRGNIKPLEQLKTARFDALIIPGGFGAAKNLSTYAINGEKMSVNKDVERTVNEFILARKPIGLCCISPVIAAKLIEGCEITVGMQDSKKKGEWPYAGTIDTLKGMGAKCVEKDVNQTHVDTNRKIVSTPAFMKTAAFHEVYDGIGKMVEEVLKLA